jgi:hypothetical protein
VAPASLALVGLLDSPGSQDSQDSRVPAQGLVAVILRLGHHKLAQPPRLLLLIPPLGLGASKGSTAALGLVSLVLGRLVDSPASPGLGYRKLPHPPRPVFQLPRLDRQVFQALAVALDLAFPVLVACLPVAAPPQTPFFQASWDFQE